MQIGKDTKMTLLRVSEEPNKPIAVIEGTKVTYLQVMFQNTIDRIGGVPLPSIIIYVEQFGRKVVPQTDDHYAEALKIFLDFEVVAKAPPGSYVWKTEQLN